MRMIDSSFRGAMSASSRLPLLATVVLAVAGCSLFLRSNVEPPPDAPDTPPATSEVDAAVDASRGEFIIVASMLDTWNAAGQILVGLDGVAYEGRSQMLGIYVVRYRGERLLIVTRALVMQSPGQGMRTKLGAVSKDGKPSDSTAAVELLGLLQRRLPAELARIAAGADKDT